MQATPHQVIYSRPEAQGLYDPAHEHDACGVGFLAHLDGQASHLLIERGSEVLRNLLHRGASGGDPGTGDGAGILTQIPDALFRQRLAATNVTLPPVGGYGVGMFFLSPDPRVREDCQTIVAAVLRDEGLGQLAWREVPVDDTVLGAQARASCPAILQVFVDGNGLKHEALDRKLYVARKQMEQQIRALRRPEARFYAVSLSCRTIVYKGMLMGGQVSGFYLDLAAPDYRSALAVVHQRYSTNTFPSWELAQPFRQLAHNGEINTLRGNIRQMDARERALGRGLLGDDVGKVRPVIEPGGSDSAALDNVLELLNRAGRDLPHAMMMLMPQAWGERYPLGPDQRGFFEYHAGLMEPWDGPAAVAFSDGAVVGAMLDRNGLRPARYSLTHDGFIVLASESGVIDLPPESIAERGALRPGQMILADLANHRLLRNAEIKSRVARRQPYRRWVEEHRVDVHGLFGAVLAIEPDLKTLLRRQRLFGYSREDLRVVLMPMAEKSHEAVGSMGHDSPLAVCSERPQLLYNYFKQLFAQVTNPPMDPLREELVMSLMTFIGNPSDILDERPAQAKLIKLRHPFLTDQDLALLRASTQSGFRARTLGIGFPRGGGGAALAAALEQLGLQAEAAVTAGDTLVILSDRDLPDGCAPIPALLAVSAVNRHLTLRGLRTSVGLLVESAEPREVMHLALLLGYGATAVNPYFAFENVAALSLDGQIGGVGVVKAIENYIGALNEGLRKIMSKMGISTLRSYRGAQVFEAIGLAPDLIERYFNGTASRIGGVGLETLAAEACLRWQAAFAPRQDTAPLLPSGGFYEVRRDGEGHLWSAEAVALLQQAVREDRYDLFSQYTAQINNRARVPFTLRSLFAFRPATPVPLEEVEPAENIMRRFVTGAMSFGSLSAEAHEAIAIAMNRIGARSNSGEGGEDPVRYRPLPNGDNRCSAIKQVASGRFGVTAEYCVNAAELQIKIAQGAKPGEGGQLPGHKVDAAIARVRHATPGVTLISPPPHHDIYSIEDIKQLIYDLRSVNPEAEVSVKLVSELGVGTIAAGVVKAGADRVLISGYDGGTGASPLSSIRHAGAPWELGLSETQQTLLLNGLRDRVRLQVDGQIKTGRDVVIGALLGAEEFGFATTVLVCLGCVMMRKCNRNTCPVGVATQDPALRCAFTGRPEHVIAFMRFIALETREHLAALGFRTLDEAIGRCDRLERDATITGDKIRDLDFGRIFHRPDAPARQAGHPAPGSVRSGNRHTDADTLDGALLPRLAQAIEDGVATELHADIRNVHRAVGTQIAGCIARRHGHAGLPEDTITLRLTGTAGQSFGAWATAGLTLELTGAANDTVGKGLSGGRIIIRPAAPEVGSEQAIAGNVLLYGATGGEAFLAGTVGERFAIRNSGARAVVEGTGDHACEYMTGGRVVVLGRTGVNFAAGMSGGIAYVYDEDGLFDTRCNLEMVDLEPVTQEADAQELRGLIERHARLTGSRRATSLLSDWTRQQPRFLKVLPIEYRQALGLMQPDDAATQREEVTHG
jgi:glutamate synthase domain-containing protein 2/glutamate synthase domain-containing protein 1/glutamate synthase domain-containing protein 3